MHSLVSGETSVMRSPPRQPFRQGSCFGFSVQSALPLRFLRNGSGEQLEVDSRPGDGQSTESTGNEPLLEWNFNPVEPFLARLYRGGLGYRLWIAGEGWFTIDVVGRRIIVPEFADTVLLEHRLWGIPAALCMLHRGDLPLHAAAIETEGAAVILAAPGHFGKTTLAAAFLQAGYRVLSEDLSCVRLSPVPSVIAGPALLRLRSDVAAHFRDLPADKVGGGNGRVSLAISEQLRGDCRPLPIAAIVCLRVSSGRLEASRAPTVEAIRDLWTLSLRTPTDSDRARCFVELSKLTRRVPTWNLLRPLQFTQLPRVLDKIVWISRQGQRSIHGGMVAADGAT